MDTQTSEISVSYSARGIPTYYLELWHEGLNKHSLIRGPHQELVIRKAQIQITEWGEKWEVHRSQIESRLEHLKGKLRAAEQKLIASEKSSEAQNEFDRLASLLKFSLSRSHSVDWETLKDESAYPVEKPVLGSLPPKPLEPTIPREPLATDIQYLPTLNFLDKLIVRRRANRIAEKRAAFKSAHLEWKTHAQSLRTMYDSALQAFNVEVTAQKSAFDAAVLEWQFQNEKFLDDQLKANASVEEKRHAYFSRSSNGAIEYFSIVLSASPYPDYFPKDFDMKYDQNNQLLILDYLLPDPENMPKLKSVKYVAATDEFESRYITSTQASILYDDVLYQTALRTVYELFSSDTAEQLRSIVFNGIVTSVNESSGQHVTACVLSLLADRKELLGISLAHVNPRACFKSLKGVGSSKLHGLSPVAPILPLNRDDGRFVSAYEVANSLDSEVNLAAMDWEDFEHLIRELFAKEFSTNGGEVKVTQASRDGGVDAIAFDPDPIRGGKIVIQAKRYTNTVGVSAVRDLFGTVLNEGATKGILVTTSDYGPDSYAFAKGKPLTLLSGANLLHLLNKHGHRACINLQEAKALARTS